MSNSERPFIATADAFGASALEMFSLEKQKDRLNVTASVDLKEEVRKVLDDVPNWLPLASEVLNISPNLKDYILSPVISMPSDLPNRNKHAFPFVELTRWQGEYGCPMYATWNGQPVHIEHKNNDPTIARGIIFKTIMAPIKNTAGDIWKVIKLVGVDRNRDSVLANDILTKKRNSWSMGAFAKNYTCSVCSALMTNGGCEHIDNSNPSFKIFAADGREVKPPNIGKLAYHNVLDAKGFEISSVLSPAYNSARDTNFFTMET